MPRSAEAQTFEFTPVVGMYTPVGLLVDGRDPSDNSKFRRRQLGALSMGARLGLRTSKMFGLEASAAFSPSEVAITNRSATVDIRGPVTMASVRGAFRVHGQMARGQWSFHLSPGIGLVHRYGDAWQGTTGGTDRAFVVAAGWRLGRLRSDRAFRFDIEDYVTRFTPDDSEVQSGSRRHHDVVWSIGLSIPVTK